jgi:hypothetical protein
MAIVLIVLASVLVMAVMAAKFTDVAVPGFTKAKVSTNEASAVASLRVINAGQAHYSTSCASGGFAVTLEDLARPPSGQDVPFVSSDVGRNGIEKNGYTLTMAKDERPSVVDLGAAASTCNASAEAPASSYFVSAAPTTPGTTGVRYFATDARGVVYASDTAIANPIVESTTVVPVQ